MTTARWWNVGEGRKQTEGDRKQMSLKAAHRLTCFRASPPCLGKPLPGCPSLTWQADLCGLLLHHKSQPWACGFLTDVAWLAALLAASIKVYPTCPGKYQMPEAKKCELVQEKAGELRRRRDFRFLSPDLPHCAERRV